MQKGVDHIGITVVFFCHDGKGNLLLNKRSEHCRDEQGRWDVGGGSLEFGDSVVDTLRKEIREEYGTDLLSYEFLGYRDVHREQGGKPTHWVALDFKVLVDPATVYNAEPHKFTEIGWYTVDTLPKPLHSQFAKVLELYKDRLTVS